MARSHLTKLGVLLMASALADTAALGQSALADAAMNRDAGSVRQLLRGSADVNGAQVDGMTALHWAVHHNDLEIVDRLLRAGADYGLANRTGATPLYLASVNANADIIARLLAAGADPNAVVTGQDETWLMLTAHTGNPRAVSLLLEAGADPNAIQIRGQTALMWAASEGHTDVIRLLAAQGANLEAASIAAEKSERRPAGGFTALLFAARQGHLDAARALVATGADVNHVSADGTSPLLVAIVNGHYDLAELLLARGADPSLADNSGRAPLYAAIDLRNQQWSQAPAPKLPQAEHMAMIRALVARGAKVDQTLSSPVAHRGSFDMRWSELEGGTAFLRAAWNGDIEVMRFLLEHGADPSVETAKGETALLLLAGAGWPLGQGHIRADGEILAALDLLVDELGMDVNAATTDGVTPLMGAVFKGTTDVAEYLIERGARLDAEDNEGRSVYRWTLGVAANMGQPPRPQPEAEALIRAALEARGMPVSEGSGSKTRAETAAAND